jgi:hypothetical protein
MAGIYDAVTIEQNVRVGMQPPTRYKAPNGQRPKQLWIGDLARLTNDFSGAPRHPIEPSC